MAQRGRPRKKPVPDRITDALGAAEQEINSKLPAAIQQQTAPEIKVEVDKVAPARISQDAQEDYDFARSNLHSLLSKGNEVLDGIVELASSSDHPRTYEVAGNLIKILIEGSRELLSLQKDIREVEKKSVADKEDSSGGVNIANAEQVNHNVVVEATTMEILDFLEAKKQAKIEGKE